MIQDALLNPVVVPVADLTHDPANARRHSTRNIDAIKASLRRFGQVELLVCTREADGGLMVRAGNGRLEAARQLGWESLAVVVVDQSEVEATAYAIAANRTAELAEWDEDALRDTLSSLGSEWSADVGFGGWESLEGDQTSVAASQWNHVQPAAEGSVKCLIGDIEFRISSDSYDRVVSFAEADVDVSSSDALARWLEGAL